MHAGSAPRSRAIPQRTHTHHMNSSTPKDAHSMPQCPSMRPKASNRKSRGRATKQSAGPPTPETSYPVLIWTVYVWYNTYAICYLLIYREYPDTPQSSQPHAHPSTTTVLVHHLPPSTRATRWHSSPPLASFIQNQRIRGFLSGPLGILRGALRPAVKSSTHSRTLQNTIEC
jgi:hypothetical protein